jgi:Protein of unknown function (DUF3558)
VRWGLIRISAGIAAALVLVTGCSDKESGNALPVTTTGGAGSTSTGRTPTTTSGAPQIKTPLDASKYLPQPCSILSANTLKELNISKPGTADTSGPLGQSVGPTCQWHTDDSPSRVYGFTIVTGNPHGLADIIRAGKKDFPGYFEPTEVSSYPAVFAGLTDDRPSGGCNVDVGISDKVSIRVGIQSNEDVGAKGCDLVKQLAATVIQTLKGA